MLHTPWSPNFRPFCSTMIRFELQANGKVHQMNPNLPWHVQGQKYQHACYIHARGPNFHPFRSMMSRLWVTGQFSEKCTEWPQMTSTCVKVKNTNMQLTYTPRPKFSSVSLYDESYGPISGKVHRMTPNDLDMFKVNNTNTCMLHTPPRPKFSSVPLYDEPFFSYGPIFGKVHRMTPNDLNMF